MSSKVYLIRHAESAHNVSHDFNLRDPGLTPLGITQATALASTFPAPLSSIAVILTSPLSRTIETTLAAFGSITSNNANNDNDEEVKLILDPDLQERSDLPCDTGSDVAQLRNKFPTLEFSDDVFKGEWYAKAGRFTADDEAVAARAREVRTKIREIVKGIEAENDGSGASVGKRDVVVVTHGVFMKFLAQDQTVDLPKAGWKAFFVGEGEDASLVAVE
ncbi:histidine phosphatase superfamily [Bombardia bombarda]|uniref:Histidine phosphatase superfamily n=1 Tax=Bombardia bombarda TaxID=252184 RepID=A0AA39WGB2_9PEZI|nr:histidine phosphatase superfamily [Bombardia bombarda]